MEGEPVDDQRAAQRPVRTFLGLFSLLAALMFGGMGAGLAIALWLAGGSVGSVALGFVFLPAVLVLGLSAWRGIATAWLVGGLGRALWRSGGDEAAFRAETLEHVQGAGGRIPGTIVFVPIAVLVSALAAVAMALVADGDRLTAGLATFLVGLGFGILLRRLARAGLLLPGA
jgi:hypothetical protein